MKNFQYILSHSSGSLTLEYSPVNWNEINFLFQRSETYHSILRNQILDIELPKDGKAYIDTIYKTYGIDADISIEIKQLDKSSFTYSTIYTGIVDLSEYSALRDTTVVKVIDSSIMAKFQNREDMEVSLSRTSDIDENAISGVTLLSTMEVEGVDFELKAEYDDGANEITITTPESTGVFADYFGVDDSGYQVNDIGTDAALPAVTLGGASGPAYTNNSGASLRVRYRIKTSAAGGITITNAGTWNYAIRAYGRKNGATLLFEHTHNGSAPDTDTVSESYDSGWITETLAAGETIEIYHEWSGSTGTATITPVFAFAPIFIEVYEIIDGDAATDVDMPLLHEVGAKLLQIITGVSDPLNAPLLGRTDSTPRTYGSDGDYAINGLATGNMLRGFLFDAYPLVTSFKDFFQSIDALFNLGLWYDGTEFIIGAKEDFYKVTEIASLGEVQDLEISVSQDHYFNKIMAGYRDTLDYEETNGKQSFNVNTQFANTVKRSENTLEVQSLYHADDYGIELARKAATDVPTSEDTQYDDNIYFVNGRRGVSDYVTNQGYDDFTLIEGVYSPATRLNLNLTPKRNLIRNGNRIGIPQFITEENTLYLSKQFELGLSTQKSGGDVVYEKNNMPYADLPEPLFYPEVYNFTAQLTADIVAQLLSDPHGYVTFEYLGETYSGYILEVSTEPFNRRGNWTLIKRNPNRT